MPLRHDDHRADTSRSGSKKKKSRRDSAPKPKLASRVESPLAKRKGREDQAPESTPRLGVRPSKPAGGPLIVEPGRLPWVTGTGAEMSATDRAFGIYRHPLPRDPAKRAEVEALNAAYKQRTGRSLLRQRNMPDALQAAGLPAMTRPGETFASTAPLDPERVFAPITPYYAPPDRELRAQDVLDRNAAKVEERWVRAAAGRGRAPISLTPRDAQSDDGGIGGWLGGVGDKLGEVFGSGLLQAPSRVQTDRFGGRIRATTTDITPTPNNALKIAAGIKRRNLGGKVTVPKWLFDEFGVMDAYAAGTGISDDDKQALEEKYGKHGVLNPEQRAALAKQAEENGWTSRDLANLSDIELVEKAFSGNVGALERIGVNALSEVASLAAAPAGVVAIGEAAVDSAEQGSVDPLATVVQAGFVDPTIRAVRHPIASFQESPITTATTLWGAAKLAGAGARAAGLGRLGALQPGRRLVTLPSRFDSPQTGAPKVLDIGRRSTNPVERPFQAAQEALLRRNEWLAGRALSGRAQRGAGTAEHLARQAASERARPLVDAAKGLDTDERMTAYAWALQGRDPAQTIRVFEEKLAANPTSVDAQYWRQQIRLARVAEQTMPKLDPDKLARVEAAARLIEPQNTDDLVAIGLDRSTLEARLGDLAIREHPDFESRWRALRDESKVEARKGIERSRDAHSWATNAERRATSLERQADRMKGRTQRGKDKQSALRKQAADLRRDAASLREETFNRPRSLKRSQAQAAATEELRGDVDPALMYMPHTPGRIGAGGRMTKSRPLSTDATDFLGGRLEARNLSTYERGRLLADPNAFERAAGATARARTLADETQTRVAAVAGHEIHLPTERDARRFEYDPEQTVIIQTGGKRFGDTKLSPKMTEARARELDDLARRVEDGDTTAAGELFRRQFGVVDRPDGIVPGSYYAMDRRVFDDLANRAEQIAKQGGTLGDITRAWRTLTLNTLPRTVANNVIGSMPMAAFGGAGPLSYARAVRELRRGGGAIPGELRGVGLAAGQTTRLNWTKPGAKQAAAWMNTMRRGNVFGEDAARGAVYLKGAHKAANKAAGRRMFAGVRPLNAEARQVLESWKQSGRPEDAQAFVDKSVDFLGDLSTGKYDSLVALAVPFHRWYRHIAKLTLVTMPAKHPGRAAFLYNLGALGDAYRTEHGVYPPWMRDMLPTGSSTEMVPGYDEDGFETQVPTEVTTGVRTGSINPFATVSQLTGDGGALGSTSPLLQTPAELVLGRQIGGPMSGEPFQDEQGQDVEGADVWTRVAPNRLIASIPLAQWATGFVGTAAGQADTSLPWDRQRRYYSRPSGGPLPEELRPTPTSEGGFLPTLMRGAGLSLGRADARGPRAEISIGKTIKAKRAERG